MQTTHPVEHGTTVSRSGVMSGPETNSQISDPLVSQKPFEPFDLENENIGEINQHPLKNLWTKVGRRLNQSTALRITLGDEGDEVDSAYRSAMIEWDVDLYLGLQDFISLRSVDLFTWYEVPYLGGRYLKTYPNSTVLDKNSTLLREMLSEIDDLLKNEYDWDAMDYREPTREDINFAMDTLIKFVQVIGCCEGYLLTKPYISNSEDGGAKLEWHSGERSLYLRIDRPEPVATTIVDNPDGTTTIEDIPFQQDFYLSLWKWIIYE